MKDKINIIIAILFIIVIVFGVLILQQDTKEESIDLNTCKVKSSLSKDTIYQEVLTEVTNGKEKFVVHTQDGKRQNNSTRMQEVHKVENVEGLEITEISITAKDRVSTINLIVKNTSEVVSGDFLITISIMDEQGREMIALGAYVNSIGAGETTTATTTTTIDIANAYDYKVKK